MTVISDKEIAKRYGVTLKEIRDGRKLVERLEGGWEQNRQLVKSGLGRMSLSELRGLRDTIKDCLRFSDISDIKERFQVDILIPIREHIQVISRDNRKNKK